MADLRVMNSITGFPNLVRVEGETIVCGGCQRRWRKPMDGKINADNLEYLKEHVLGHRPSVRQPPRGRIKRLLGNASSGPRGAG
jgi:hypothetical protein